jgi:hypothetical protein
MADNNKYIQKLPETRTEIFLNQEQQNQDKQKQTEKEQELKALESYSEEIEVSGQTSGFGPSDDDKVEKGIAKGVGGAALAAASIIPGFNSTCCSSGGSRHISNRNSYKSGR